MVFRSLVPLIIALLLPAMALAAKIHVVKSGDNLYDLSTKYGVSVQNLKTENNLVNNKLNIGDELVIPATGSSASSNKTSNNTYTIKSGDTLSKVAEKHEISTVSLKEANNLKSNKLKIGQKLLIPSSIKSAEKPKNTSESKNAGVQKKESKTSQEKKTLSTEISNPGTYTVQSGDTLGHIAEKYGTHSKHIKQANNLKSDKLSIGQVLTIPSKEATAKTVAKKTQEQQKTTTQKTKPAKPQTATTKAQEIPKSQPNKYVVKNGDTLGHIAEKLGVSTKNLRTTNNLKNDKLHIGQELKVPGTQTAKQEGQGTTAVAKTPAKTAKSKQAGKPPEEKSSQPQVHTVKKGDNLYDISRKYKVSTNDIKKWNNLKNNNLSIGQQLSLSPAVVATSDSNTVQSTESAKASKQNPEKKTTAESKPEKPKKSYNYTVKNGDTLGHIALNNGVTVKEIKNANAMRSDKLRLGQTIKIPGEEKEHRQVERTTTIAEKSQSVAGKEIYIKKRHVVKSGDSLSKIASNYNVTVNDIKKASSLKNDRINKGDILLIPVPQQRVTQSHYIVARGDTLGKIAKRHGVSVKALKNANRLRSDNISVGKKLTIPGYGAPVATASPSTYAKAKSSSYIVRQGDTLGLIAQKHGTSLYTLRDANNIKGNTIWAGQTLIIPHSSGNLGSYSTYNSKYYSNSGLSQDSIVNMAKRYLGAPYKFGGYSFTTGIDCSGYVKKVFSSFNVNLPRTARDIFYKSGHQVSKKNLDTGDLVFFQTYAKYPSHVGIYIGNGNNEFIHASSGSKMVTIDTMNKRYYRQRYIGAKRINLTSVTYDN